MCVFNARVCISEILIYILLFIVLTQKYGFMVTFRETHPPQSLNRITLESEKSRETKQTGNKAKLSQLFALFLITLSRFYRGQSNRIRNV